MSPRPPVHVPQVSSKVLCLAWTPDGLLLAAGCYDGGVSIRDRGGAERVRVAAGVTPAWSVAWSPGVGDREAG